MSIPPSSSSKGGFSLVELSIVLIIIWLVIAGVLTGTTLIKTAQLRKTYKEFETYSLAAAAFKDKYRCLPGDCETATDFFGTDSEGCDTATTTKTVKTTTCNGNGDGWIGPTPEQIVSTDIYTARREQFTFWQQLASAGLIPGSFSGSAANSFTTSTIGTSCPTILSSATVCWVTSNTTNTLQSYWPKIMAFPGLLNKNIMAMSVASSMLGQTQYFTPSEALQYDTKFDDGVPVTGNIQSLHNITGGAHCSTVQAVSATYDLSYTTPQCALYHVLPVK